MSRPIDAVLSRLEQFKLRENGRDRWRACCPAHGGSNASALSIGIGQNDAVLLRCWQGCGIDEVAGDDEVNVKFGATIDGLKSKMAEAGVSIKEFAKGAGEQIETLNRSIAGIRGAFASIAELATLGFIGEQPREGLEDTPRRRTTKAHEMKATKKPTSTALQSQQEAPAVPAKIGHRPSKYTRNVAQAICRRLAGGEILSAICRDPGMPEASTVRAWALEDRDGFRVEYQVACGLGYDGLEDAMREAANDSSGDMTVDEEGRPVVNHENINRSRLKVDTIKWLLSKRKPAIYGDRLEQKITGTFEMAPRPDLSKLSPAELEAFELLMSKAVIAP